LIKCMLIILIPLSGGLAVGSSVAAFFVVLGVTVKIVKLCKREEYLVFYQLSLVLGALLSCVIYFFDFSLKQFSLLAVPIGLLFGIFTGMVAAALTETLDIITIAVNQLKITKWLYLIVLVIILGKAAGSLLFFLFPGF
jgi:stage V sporulation protein AB